MSDFLVGAPRVATRVSEIQYQCEGGPQRNRLVPSASSVSNEVKQSVVVVAVAAVIAESVVVGVEGSFVTLSFVRASSEPVMVVIGQAQGSRFELRHL